MIILNMEESRCITQCDEFDYLSRKLAEGHTSHREGLFASADFQCVSESEYRRMRQGNFNVLLVVGDTILKRIANYIYITSHKK